ncbi:MAG: polyribonucleotide nucleotidyltransferase [Parcubacteria group bacterium]|nr:polyribonucleotide nucleotidyltransferase [Parcubacteria group bacterium]
MSVKTFETDYGGRKFSVEIGRLAGQANGAVFVRYADTSVLVTATMNKKPKDANYMPLVIDYEERFYAAGKIKGSRWVKRETRPSDGAILSARLIDRTLRPLFDSRIRNEIQIVATVLSYDGLNDPDIPSVIGASLALGISDIPFDGVVSAARVGRIDGNYVLNPISSDLGKSDFDVVVSGPKERINMLEAGAQIVDDKVVLGGIEFGLKQYQKMIEFQKEIIAEFKPVKQKIDFFEPQEDLVSEIRNFLGSRLEKAIYLGSKQAMYEELNQLKSEMQDWLKEHHKDNPGLGKMLQYSDEIFESEIDRVVHEGVLENNKRPDGRKLDEIRPLSIDVGILPRTHGTGLFSRGQTQILSILTLAAPSAEQWIETPEMEIKKHYMHHYNFPPYSSGEVGRMGFTGRREIGHGALAERALMAVIPDKDKFPYTMRIVSESLSSNGSTSMASVCGSTLALMDGGVPISAPVAGISTGLMLSDDGKKFKIITDIQGPEDHHGDMDLKIAGTENGVTAIQMDVKIQGVTIEILESAFEQSKKARKEILEAMAKVIKDPRQDLSPFAPHIYMLQINPEKIGKVIGPQGKVINEIISETGADIDIEDDGNIFITAETSQAADKAIAWIKSLTREIKPGEVFEGKVKRILDFGAFIEIMPGHEGLVHISEISTKRVERVSDALKLGDVVKVKVKNIDELGRINLTMKF